MFAAWIARGRCCGKPGRSSSRPPGSTSRCEPARLSDQTSDVPAGCHIGSLFARMFYFYCAQSMSTRDVRGTQQDTSTCFPYFVECISQNDASLPSRRPQFPERPASQLGLPQRHLVRCTQQDTYASNIPCCICMLKR
eukprot:1176215-Prorocentrum_minimum.AAC.1